jgi:hypothetical protein
MKLYVLEEPAPAEQQLPVPQMPRRSRIVGVGGAIALLLFVGALVVAGVLIGGPEGTSANVRQLAVIAAAPPLPAGTEPLAPPMTEQQPTLAPVQQGRAINTASDLAGESSIVRRGGKFFVDLHDVDVGSALVMMSQATRTTVVGADVLRDQPARLTARLTATSPQSAWQSVFGNVANFAVSCVGEACVVHIVSAVGGKPPTPPPLPADAIQAPSDPTADLQTESSMAAAVAALRQQQTTYSEDY